MRDVGYDWHCRLLGVNVSLSQRVAAFLQWARATRWVCGNCIPEE